MTSGGTWEGLPRIDPGRPLIITDADEVILHFIDPLITYLRRNDFDIDLSSYRLFGNIYRKSTGEKAGRDDMKSLLAGFFSEEVDHQSAVENASETLASFTGYAQIVVLTNVPDEQRERRSACLARQGMNYPVIANEGDKGQVVQELASRTRGPAVFIDDIPAHHQSVAALAPDVLRLHFVADERLRSLIEPTSDAHHRTDSWLEAGRLIRDFFRLSGFSDQTLVDE